MMKWFTLVFACFCLIAGARAEVLAERPSVTGYRIGGTEDQTRFVIDATLPLKFSIKNQNDPPQIILTVPKLAFHAAIDNGKGRYLIRRIRLEDNADGTNIMLDLTAPAHIDQSFMIPARDGKSPRLVVDLSRAGDEAPPVMAEKDPASFKTAQILREPAGKAPEKNMSSKASPEKTASKDMSKKPDKVPVRVVVIDAGHGGVDPGAISPSGTEEKDITLAVAKALQKELSTNPRYKVYLTRSSDIFIRLRERRDIGRRKKADLFISLHADSMGNGDSDISGASFYTISTEASDEESAKLADRENLADAIAGIDLKDQESEVASILIDLAMRETMNQSKRFAGQLSSSFKDSSLTLLDRPMRAAGFAVLKAPDVPSVLIEMGFLSSAREEELLKTAPHRARLAKAIAHGVNDYFDYMDEREN